MALEQASLGLAELTDEGIRREVGWRLTNLRKRSGMDQPQVSSVLSIGVSAISRIENGKNKNPNVVILLRMIDLYGATPEYVFGDLGSMRVFPQGEAQHLDLIEGEGRGARGVLAGQGNLLVSSVPAS